MVSGSRGFYLSTSPSLSFSSSALGPLLSPVSIWCVPSDTWRESLSVVLLSISEGLVKNPPADAGDIREVGSTPGSGRSPAGGHGNTLQYSYLENPMDRGAWQATVHGVAKSQTQLNDNTFMVSDQFILSCPEVSNFGGESFTSQGLL